MGAADVGTTYITGQMKWKTDIDTEQAKLSNSTDET